MPKFAASSDLITGGSDQRNQSTSPVFSGACPRLWLGHRKADGRRYKKMLPTPTFRLPTFRNVKNILMKDHTAAFIRGVRQIISKFPGSGAMAKWPCQTINRASWKLSRACPTVARCSSWLVCLRHSRLIMRQKKCMKLQPSCIKPLAEHPVSPPAPHDRHRCGA